MVHKNADKKYRWKHYRDIKNIQFESEILNILIAGNSKQQSFYTIIVKKNSCLPES